MNTPKVGEVWECRRYIRNMDNSMLVRLSTVLLSSAQGYIVAPAPHTMLERMLTDDVTARKIIVPIRWLRRRIEEAE